MVKLALQLSATLENVASIKPDPEKQWDMKVKCSSCHEVHENPVVCSASDEYELHGSRGTANLVMKCHFCGRDMSLNFVDKSIGEYSEDDDNQLKTMLIVECRGMEVVGWLPGEGYIIKSSQSSTLFDSVSLDEEFYDYDEEASVPVSISELKTEVVRSK